MVRRWSYINSLNYEPLLTSRSIHKASVDTNLNTLMYLKKRYALSTKLTRKQWARRKHVHNWIAPSNILKDWAKSYRFHRNSAKLVYYQFFTKNSFIAFNLVAARNSIPSLNKGSEKIVTGSYVKRLLKFFNAHSNTRFRFFCSFQTGRLLAISLLPGLQKNQILDFFDSQVSVVPLYVDNLTSLMPWTAADNRIALLQHSILELTRNLLNLVLSQLLTLYRVLLLLSVMRLT